MRLITFVFIAPTPERGGGTAVCVVGSDSRVSGAWLRPLVHSILVSGGFKVLDAGIVPTPTVQYLVIKQKARCGIICTSSHNDTPWNGLKFVDTDGLFLSPEKCNTLFASADRLSTQFFMQTPQLPFVQWDKTGEIVSLGAQRAQDLHIAAITELPYIAVADVRRCAFSVVLDSVNGAVRDLPLSRPFYLPLADIFSSTLHFNLYFSSLRAVQS